MDAFYQAALRAGDFAFGWLLALPRDAAIVLVAAGTATLLVLVRPFATDQGLLRRCREDRRTLAGRIRRARAHARGEGAARLTRVALDALDREGLEVPATEEGRLRRLVGRWHRRQDAGRLAAVKQRVALKALRQEVLPLLLAILPVALLATWCFARLAYLPPRGGQGDRGRRPLSAGGGRADRAPRAPGRHDVRGRLGARGRGRDRWPGALRAVPSGRSAPRPGRIPMP